MMARPRLLLKKRALLLQKAYRAQSRFVDQFAFELRAEGCDTTGCFRFRDFLGYQLQEVMDNLAELPDRTDDDDCPPLTSEQMRVRLVHIRAEGGAA